MNRIFGIKNKEKWVMVLFGRKYPFDHLCCMECIILAGGLGTRLRSVTGDRPKCMAPVKGKPFLHYMLEYLEQQGCTRLILSLGYRHELVTEWLSKRDWPFPIVPVVETEPLGTGGGIRLALGQSEAAHVMVLNGDTMFRAPLQDMLQYHLQKGVETTVALKPMREAGRYGLVQTDEDNMIISFGEKEYAHEGLINGGIYCVDRERFLSRQLPGIFSFEKDYLEGCVQERTFAGYIADAYFIDIGIPEDYARAQKEF
jgi:D-glycero-alpha-D-manno-heptose 1-phosphate guanylyltransferase